MYEEWYSQQYNKYNDSFNSEWEVFGIRSQPSADSLAPLERLSAQAVFGWLESGARGRTQSNTGVASHSRFSLVFTRHRQHRFYEVNPSYLSFKEETFKKILQMMKLPLAYAFMRVNAGASGNFAKYSTFDDHGSISQLSFLIRVPHSPRTNEKAVWSLACSWDANTLSTTGLFESLSDADMREVDAYFSGKPQQRQHPLFLPNMLLDLLIMFYVGHRRRQEHLLFVLESQLGITRGQRKTDAWDWGYELHRQTTKDCNTVYTSLVYLERQLDFTLRLADFVLQCIAYCQEEEAFPPTQRAHLLRVSKEMKESVLNSQNFTRCQLHQVLCLQKRAQALVSVIYSVVAQKDSRTNVAIAKAAKQDSSSMTAIAILGTIFLPAMLVASMFSMSMFDFSSTSTSSSVFVSSNFWIYWAVTIPLTLAILAIWKIWMRSVEKSVLEDESKKEKEMEVWKGIPKAHPERSSPLYPKTGYFWLDG